MDNGLGAQGATGWCHMSPQTYNWTSHARHVGVHANSTMQARKKASKVVEEEEEPEEASVPEVPAFARRCVLIIRDSER